MARNVKSVWYGADAVRHGRVRLVDAVKGGMGWAGMSDGIDVA